VNIITFTQIAGFVGGILFVLLGFHFRKHDAKKNWVVFVAAGVAFIAFSLLVLFGIVTLE
jgi:peptidoglycan/LPS O-acetylase OafA/YrhL